MKNYYKILGVAKNASRLDIRRAYLEKVKLYHPDLNSSPSAPSNFKDVQEAYNTLYDTNKRREYDNLNSRFGRSTHTSSTNQYRNNTGGHPFNFDSFEEQFRAEADELRRQWQEMEAKKYKESNDNVKFWNVAFNSNSFPSSRLRFIFYFINRILPLILFPLSLIIFFSIDVLTEEVINKTTLGYKSYMIHMVGHIPLTYMAEDIDCPDLTDDIHIHTIHV